MDDSEGEPRAVAVIGPFQPAAIAKLLPTEEAARLAPLKAFAGTPVSWLAEALVRRGVKPTVIGGVRGVDSMWIESPSLNVSIYKSSGGWPFVLNGRRRERREILARLQQLQPDIAHAMWTLEGGRAVADWRGPKLLTVHDAAWEYQRLGWSFHPISLSYGARWLLNTRATIARFRHLIAVSPYLESYLRITPRFPGEIRVIPNAIPDFPADIKIVDKFPRAGTLTFACYGEPGPLKNIVAAIKAFRIVLRSMPDARLYVFGGGWSKAQAEFKDEPRIVFRGGMPHHHFLQCLAQEVDIWVHPSRIETHGIAFCEAILAGCPVIAGMRSGAVPWALDYGRAGLLVDVESPDEIAEAMRTLVHHRRRAEEMVAHGRRYIQENFNAKRVLDLHLQYYRDILAHS